jgi:hypothetical protein
MPRANRHYIPGYIWQRSGIKVKGRKIVEKGGSYTLREPMSDYGLYSGPENNAIVPENRNLWDVL